MRVWLSETTIVTRIDQMNAFNWCNICLGEPNKKWLCGREILGFMCSIDAPAYSIEDITYYDFVDEQDALAFKMKF